MSLSLLISFAPLVLALACAAIIDMRTRRIPNWLTFSLLVAGLARAIFMGHPGSVNHALLGMVVGAAFPLVLFVISAGGGGDVKMMAAIGAWVGPGPVFVIYLVEKVVGLVMVLVQAMAQKKTPALFRNSALVVMNLANAGQTGMRRAIEATKDLRSVDRPLPLAIPTFIATCLVIWLNLVGR